MLHQNVITKPFHSRRAASGLRAHYVVSVNARQLRIMRSISNSRKMIAVYEKYSRIEIAVVAILFELCYAIPELYAWYRFAQPELTVQILRARFRYSIGGIVYDPKNYTRIVVPRNHFPYSRQLRHYRGYREAVDHFHGFASAILIPL